jgi:hypothetical protein
MALAACRLTGVDWRQKIENQRGAVLATELKNNANKLARWTSAALVAGVDLIKLGYVARAHPRDRHHHVILSTQVGRRADLCAASNGGQLPAALRRAHCAMLEHGHGHGSTHSRESAKLLTEVQSVSLFELLTNVQVFTNQIDM